MPAGGGDAFRSTYGDWDQTNPRWSPDGSRIAFISNRTGNTEIDLIARARRGWRNPSRRRAPLPCADGASASRPATMRRGNPAAARISVTDAAGRFHAPADAWIHADDGFDRRERAFEAHYFHARGDASIDVPAGPSRSRSCTGFERRLERRTC